MTPPGIAVATDWRERRVLEGEAEVAREDCARAEAALRAALVAAAQAWRDLRGAAQRLGAAQSRLTGREARSIIDERLQPTRAEVSAATMKLEADIWSAAT
jgi:hypothetical protein